MAARALQAVALLICLLVAGCTAPTASPAAEAIGGTDPIAESGQAPGVSTTATPTHTSAPPSEAEPGQETETATATPRPDETDTAEPSPEQLAAGYDIEVVDGDLPVDYSLVFARVAVTVDRPTVAPPRSVVIRPPDRMRVGRQQYPEFYRLVGVTAPEGQPTATTAAAYVASPETVTVNEAVLNDSAEAESTLAHESVHVVQFRDGTFQRLRGSAAAPAGSTEARLLHAGVVEGSATYVQREYVRRYRPDAPDPVVSLAAASRSGSTATGLGIAPYVVGARYVDERVDDPRDLDTVYANPPRTTEELLHGLPPGSEPLATLVVTDDPNDRWRADLGSRDTHGELFLRVVMESGLNESAAATAADGWGNDVRLGFTRAGDASGTTGYVWVVRFDDEANATEFQSAFAEWRDERASDAAPVRLVRVSPETVAVLVGAESFVEDARPTGTDGVVSVRVDAGE
ncbi:hypothetical protein [Halobaculum marinum]|uniref:DUF4157 domain-containing protein n=1 Tax=Halobaculum marinum TaxID=3031996 RepID=A0ABD5WYT6_9EURY|nr:hypothetical protein [Halobaculum sp. DT55]